MNRHSPLELMIALHHYGSAVPYAQNDHRHQQSPAVRRILHDFVCDGLLTYCGYSPSIEYEATDKLRAWVEGLCSVPMPKQKWQIDWGQVKQ